MLEVQEYATSLPAWPELMDLTSSGDKCDGVSKITSMIVAVLICLFKGQKSDRVIQ